MRLLNAKTLELVDVRDDAIPPYAILSHTWGNEEITLQELRHMKGRMPQSLDKRKRTIADKKGFVKVRDAAALAVSKGLSYIWVDTCCIDKSSSAELSEAINSMYLWYQQSRECYAFLSDVKSAKEEDWASADSSLRRSRWFSRGWTLQELIAPKAVQFYARDWSLLGHKDGPETFMEIIGAVTGIDVEVLDGRIDPLQRSVSTRMKWASHRLTTRLEDTAYSLMGLFQVNMPLLYGEGHRAFRRLQEEIIQRSDDQSLYAWNSFENDEEDPDALSGLLAHSPEQFRDAGNIQPLPPSPVYASAPSGMTNHGLRVQLYLRPILEEDEVLMEEDYYAILDCNVRAGDLYLCPAIRLRKLSNDQYARLQTKSRILLPPLESKFPEYEGYQTIFVRQQPVYYRLPEFRVSPVHFHSSASRQHYELAEIFPPRQWNSTTMTMKAKFSRKFQAMGVFRFRSHILVNEVVDLVVGLTRLDAEQWEGWCFQRSCLGTSLELTLSTVNQKIAELTKTTKSVVSSGLLRDSVGHDSRLVTDGTVEAIELHGRFYISIAMSLKPEIQTMKELPLLLKQQGLPLLTGQSQIRIPMLRYFQVRILTSACSRSYNADSILSDDFGSKAEPIAVRGKPSSSSGLGTSLDSFMKPIHEFLEAVRNRKLETDPEPPLDIHEELALALFEGNRIEIKRLLAMRVDLDTHTSDVYGFAPLHWAVAGASIESIRILLQQGANLLSITREGWTTMHVSALLNRSVWKSIKAHNTSTEFLEELANKRTRDHLDSPLHLAAAYCPNSEYGLSFFWELSKDFWAYRLLGSRNKHDETPIHRAAALNNDGIIRSIVQQHKQFRPDFVDVVDQYGRSPLWHAAATGSCDSIKALLYLKASIDLTDDMGRSPLHAACRGGHQEAVLLLLQEGALQSTHTSILGLTAMDYAAMFGHTKCLKHLALSSSLIEMTSNNRALHIAASCGWLACVKLLCFHGSNPFLPFNHYLKLDDSKSYAMVVDERGDAQEAARKEGHLEISHYFATSSNCKRYRGPIGDALADFSWSSSQDGENRTALSIASDDQSMKPVLPQSPPQTIVQFVPPLQLQSTDYQPPPLATHSALSSRQNGPQSYSSVPESARDSLSIPRPQSKIGSHSATLPAYHSPAYLGTEYRDANQNQSSQLLNPYGRLSFRQSLSVQDPKSSTLSHGYSDPYGAVSVRRPQTYSGVNRVFTSLPYTLPAADLNTPDRYDPAQYIPIRSALKESAPEPHASLLAPRRPRPSFSEPIQNYNSNNHKQKDDHKKDKNQIDDYQKGDNPNEYNPRPIGQPINPEIAIQASWAREKWVRMLGQLGDASMLLDDSPTDPKLLNYDNFIQGFVYQTSPTVFEMAHTTRSLPQPSVPVVPATTQHREHTTRTATADSEGEDCYERNGLVDLSTLAYSFDSISLAE